MMKGNVMAAAYANLWKMLIDKNNGNNDAKEKVHL